MMLPPTLSRRGFLVAGLTATLTGCGSSDADKRPSRSRQVAALEEVRAMARRLIAETGVPGLAMAVVQDRETCLAEGLGVIEAGSSLPVDSDTVFQLASVSKSLGATVIARQIGLGHVTWDTPLRTLLPWFALSRADSTERLTVGDCYAHLSGLPEHAGDLLEELGYDRQEILQRLRSVPVAPLRSRYAYTNFGLTAAAEGVAQATGSDWASLCDEALYTPLGMTRTSSRHADFLGRHNRARTHMQIAGRWQPGPLRTPDAQSAAGGVSSSVHDMARWLTMLLANGHVNGRQLVAADALQTALTPRALPTGSTGYGYGFNAGQTAAGRRLISHSGAFAVGAATSFMALPDLGAGIVVLTNAQPIGLAEALCSHYLDLLENGRPTADWWALYRDALKDLLAPTGSTAGQPPPADPAPAQPLARYTGSYPNAHYGSLLVWQDGGALYAQLGPLGRPWRLQHWSGDDFVFVASDESALLGERSLARFLLEGTPKVQLEYYDEPEGLGVFG